MPLPATLLAHAALAAIEPRLALVSIPVLALLAVLILSANQALSRVPRADECVRLRTGRSLPDHKRNSELTDALPDLYREADYWLSVTKVTSGLNIVLGGAALIASRGEELTTYAVGFIAFLGVLATTARVGQRKVGQKVNADSYDYAVSAVKRRIIYAHIAMAIFVVSILTAVVLTQNWELLD